MWLEELKKIQDAPGSKGSKGAKPPYEPFEPSSPGASPKKTDPAETVADEKVAAALAAYKQGAEGASDGV